MFSWCLTFRLKNFIQSCPLFPYYVFLVYYLTFKFTTILLAQLCVSVGVYSHVKKHVHHLKFGYIKLVIARLPGEPPARRVSGHACACVMASLLPLFKISIFDFGIVVLFLLRFSYISSSVFFFFFHLINQLVNLYSNTHICALEVKSTTLYHFSSFS